MGICINVQSLRDPVFIETRVEVFLENFCRTLENFPDKDFDLQKEGLVVKKLERLKNLGDETSHFWRHITSGYYDFTRRTHFEVCVNHCPERCSILRRNGCRYYSRSNPPRSFGRLQNGRTPEICLPPKALRPHALNNPRVPWFARRSSSDRE